ncbi:MULTISPECIES: manganese efflux pump MntP family protein [Methanoculleus]|jgi:putative Mn2+ efflux pump MntP|uniref:Putative manganese efflux pump MntP n=1 Tax=Methanoculleus thermophilus TaxID=2200 RepID=A0A1G8X6D6_9EURY|nr:MULTISPECIES: manganese efflux pump MntP family protein [Methanoculleus]NLN09140.1 manganese efflux pump [Methanoculleus thermophilus]SDJ86021.1 Putative Mn2+ efflux pump MntP [Methanoculleus thermophilus]
MEFVTVLLIAAGLAMDAFAVSISGGTTVREDRVRWALIIGGLFGGFQAAMPVLGWLGGVNLASFVGAYAPWIAFILLALIGGRMVIEAVLEKGESVQFTTGGIATLLLLAIATSIDALAVGITFAVLDTPILWPVVTIGLVTFALSAAGVLVGSSFGRIFGRKVEILGGVILIGIGLRILLDHLLF